MTYFQNSCETDYIKVKEEHSMHSSHRNTTKDEALCLSPAPARFSHFFLLNDFSPLSRSLEQARYSEDLNYISFRLQIGFRG